MTAYAHRLSNSASLLSARELNRSRGSSRPAFRGAFLEGGGNGFGASCLKIEGLATPLQTGAAHDKGVHLPTSPSHD